MVIFSCANFVPRRGSSDEWHVRSFSKIFFDVSGTYFIFGDAPPTSHSYWHIPGEKNGGKSVLKPRTGGQQRPRQAIYPRMSAGDDRETRTHHTEHTLASALHFSQGEQTTDVMWVKFRWDFGSGGLEVMGCRWTCGIFQDFSAECQR